MMQGMAQQEIREGMAKGRVVALLAAVILAGVFGGGCASTDTLLPAARAEAAQQHAAFVVREAQEQSARLRQQVAAARIEMAKQEADLRALRLQVAELEAGRDDLQRTAEARQTELATLRAERAEWIRTRADLQVQVAELPVLRHSMAELRMMQDKLLALEATLTSLVAEMAEVKKLLRPKAARKSATSNARPRSGPAAKTPPKGAR